MSDVTAPFVAGSDTSFAAAQRITKSLSKLEHAITTFMSTEEASGNYIACYELTPVFDWGASTPSARLRGLELKGYVRKRGEKHMKIHPRSGKKVNTYELCDIGPQVPEPRENRHEPKHSSRITRALIKTTLIILGPDTRDGLTAILERPASTIGSAVSDLLMLGELKIVGIGQTRRGYDAKVVDVTIR